MSTRTIVQIFDNGEKIANLYRHMDGYPAETAADILETFKVQHYAGNYANALLAKKYDKQDYQEVASPIYRIEATPGDIEWLYQIFFDYDPALKYPKVTFNVARRPYHNEPDLPFDTWTKQFVSYTPGEFAAMINQERKEMNQRLVALQAESPFYKDSEPYPMVAAYEIPEIQDPREVYNACIDQEA